MSKSKHSKGYIADIRHDLSADPKLSFRDTYDECVDLVHQYFLSFGFELIDGRPYDAGNDIETKEADGFNCFQNVKLYNGKVAEFMHCDGEGPVAYIHKNN